MAESQPPGPSCTYLTLVLTLAALLFSSALVLVVLLYTWHYSGFQGTSPIVVSFCTQLYFLVKYSDLSLNNKTVFIASGVSCASAAILLIIILSWVVRNCHQATEWSLCAKRFAILMVILSLTTLVVPCAHYLTLLVELKQCTVTKDDTQLYVLTIIAVFGLCVGIVLWIALMCRQSSVEEKYIDRGSESEQKENKKQRKGDRRGSEIGQERFREKLAPLIFEEREDTKEDMLNRHSYRNSRIQSEDPIPVALQTQKNRQYTSTQARFVPRDKKENPVTNLHPYLADESKDPYHRLTDDRKGTFIRHNQEQEVRYLTQQRKRHFRDYDSRPILRRAEPREYQQRRYNRERDYIRQEEYDHRRRDDYEDRRRGDYMDRRRDDYEDRRRDEYSQYESRPRRDRRRSPPPRREDWEDQWREDEGYEERDYPKRKYFRSPPKRQPQPYNEPRRRPSPDRYQTPQRYEQPGYDPPVLRYERTRPSYAKQHRF